MVPVRAFHADPVYGIAHPVDLEGKCPGQEVERDFSLGYGFTLCHLYACLRSPGDIPSVPLKLPSPFLPGLSGVFGEGGRTPVPGIAVILVDPVLGKQSFFFAHLSGILPGTVNAILSDVRGSYAITSFIVGPGSGKILKHNCE